MNWLVENWSMLVVVLAVAVCALVYIMKFAQKPTQEQIKAVKEWLLYAVSAAERDLGGGTGALKLRSVYESFAVKFPWVAKFVSFDLFSVWVDTALLQMRHILETNESVKGYIEKK